MKEAGSRPQLADVPFPSRQGRERPRRPPPEVTLQAPQATGGRPVLADPTHRNQGMGPQITELVDERHSVPDGQPGSGPGRQRMQTRADHDVGSRQPSGGGAAQHLPGVGEHVADPIESVANGIPASVPTGTETPSCTSRRDRSPVRSRCRPVACSMLAAIRQARQPCADRCTARSRCRVGPTPPGPTA